MADINAILQDFQAQLGKPYVWGGTGPNGFDCSGLVQYVFGQNGISLPRTSEQQTSVGTSVPIGQEQPGDLVFSNWGDGPSSHVAVFIGNGEVIESPEPGKTVEVTPLNQFYLSHVSNIQRVTGVTGTANTGNPITDGLSGPLSGISSALGSIGSSIAGFDKIATALDKLSLPQTWVRIFAGLIGFPLVFYGIWTLVKEVK